MKRAFLDGRLLTTKEEILTAIGEQLAFPEWYGKNLDALYDCLTELAEPTALVLICWSAEGEQGRVLRVLRDAEREVPHLSIGLFEK